MKTESTALNKIAMDLDAAHPLRASLLDYQKYLQDDMGKQHDLYQKLFHIGSEAEEHHGSGGL